MVNKQYRDKQYRETINVILESHDYYIHTVLYYRTSEYAKKVAWLLVMGLAETWDITQ